MPTTTETDGRLKKITVAGQGLKASMLEACTSASLSASNSQVTEMAFTFADNHSMDVGRSKLLAPGAAVSYGDWRLVSDKLHLGPGPLGPEVQIVCPSKFVTRLRGQKGAKDWGNVALSGWVADVAKSVGMRHVVQPGLGNRSIVRRKAEDGSEAETTWDVLAQLSRESGVWLFEYGTTLVFAKPSWLVRTSWARRSWPVRWDSWTDYGDGLAGMPVYDDDPNNDTRESLVVSLVSADADQARTGDEVVVTGKYAGPMKGTWIVQAVEFPLNIAAPVKLTCQRPVDPKVEEPRSDKTKTGTGTTSVGGTVSSSLSAKVDAWEKQVAGRPIDMDGAYGAQCVDLTQHYNVEVVGGARIWGNGNQWYAAGGSNAKYTQVPQAAGPGRKGDIACWGAFYGGGFGHAAVVLADQGSSLLCMSQNPGAPKRWTLSKQGLTGYLRPKG